MNVVYCIDEFPPVFWGGLGTYAKEMTRRLIGQGIHPAVLSRNTGTLPVSDLWNGILVYRPDIIAGDDIIPHISPCDVGSWAFPDQRFFFETFQYNLLGSYHFIRTLHQTKKHPLHLVAAHDWPCAIAGLFIRKNLNIPLVFHFHSHEQGRMEIPSQIIAKIEKKAADTADAIITVSQGMKDALVNLGYPEDKIHVVHNGVDSASFDPRLFSRDTITAFRNNLGVFDHPMILYVGRLTRVKGVEELIRAMPDVLKEIPTARLVVIGVGESEEGLRELVLELGLQDAVIMKCQHLSEEELKMCYAACDCAVFPSHYEAFGIVCTEAMAMEKPVIVGVSGTSGLYEQVIIKGDEQNGFHIDPHSPQDIAKHICILLTDPEMRRRFGIAGRKRVLSHLTWDITVQKTTEIYRRVLSLPKQN